MPRGCGWCNDPRHVAWEQRIAQGEAVSAVAADTPFHVTAASRHLRMHVRPTLAGQMHRTESTVKVSDFAHKLLTLVSAAEAVRLHAESLSNPRLALQAIKTQTDILSVLMQRLGVDSEETGNFYVETDRSTAAVASALGSAIRSGRYPQLAADVARSLEDSGHPETAANVRTLDTTAQIEETK